MAAARKGMMGLLSEEPEADDEFMPDEFDDIGMAETEGLDTETAIGGAFESYADTMFNPEATPEEKSAALRSAIETVLEERETGGGMMAEMESIDDLS